MCNIAFQARWANRVETDRTFPFDDRQYYETITNFLAQKTTYQANGIMLIDQAFELLAMNAVMLKGRELNQTVSGYFRSGFCDFVMGNSQNESMRYLQATQSAKTRTRIFGRFTITWYVDVWVRF